MTTATAMINRRPVEFTVTQHNAGGALCKHLLASGFDGTVWTGSAPATARRGEKHAMFYRTTSGKFVLATVVR